MVTIPESKPEKLVDNGIYGLVLSRVNDDILRMILRLYDDTLSGHAQERMDPSSFRDALSHRRFDFMLGSWSSPRTRLFAVSYFRKIGEVLRFSAFTPGIPASVEDIKLVKELRENERQFGQRVSEFLRDSRAGTPLM